MLRGLELMTPEEYREVGQLIGLDLGRSKGQTQRLLAWMAKVVEHAKGDPAMIERAVLEWVARLWSIEFEADIDTNDLERLLRRRIATEATDFLAPAWRVACAFMVEDSSVVADQKFEMLKSAAGQVVPSESVLETHCKEWAQLASTWSRSDPRSNLKTDLDILQQHPGLGRQALRLGLVLALADGRLSTGEKRLVRDVGPAMGLSESDSRELVAELNELFSEHRSRLTKESKLGPIMLGVEAAQLALAECGAVQGLAREARENVVHEDPEAKGPETTEPDQTLSGWSRLLGALSGIAHFFSAKIDEEAPANLVRIVYFTIEKQRAEVVKLRSQRS
jgi:hypothetical protein